MSKKKEVPLWARTGHAAPVSRRDFLAAGIIPFAAAAIAPRWMNLLLPEQAFAASCQGGASSLVPFVTLNLAGGAALSANYVPQDAGLQPLSNYDLMGLGRTAAITREFGNVPFAANVDGGNGISTFLQGVRQRAPNAIAKTAFVAVCVRSRDDFAENKFSIDGLLSKAGLFGSLLPNLGRRQNSITGIGQSPAVVSPPAPLIVNNFDSLTSSLGYASALGSRLKPNQKGALARLISRLSDSQTRKLASVQSGNEVKNLLDCAGVKNQELIAAGTNAVDPRLDIAAGTQLNQIWGIDGGTGAGNQNLIFASMTYNALKGNCGSVSLEIGGYDYHDGSRNTGNNKDREAGEAVGRILESANALNQPVFVYVCSDGSVTSASGSNAGAAWNSDRGSAGVTYILYFDPAGRRETSSYQIGHFIQGQAADEATPVGASPEAAAAAVFANYLAINNRLDLFNALAGRALDNRALSQVLKFG